MHDSIIHHVDLFFGSADPAQARIYAAVTLTENHKNELDQFQLSGHLIGPTCDFAHTLTARIPFVTRKTDNTLLAEAIVPDPCFWTPELPFLYRADLQLTKNQTIVEQQNGIVGIRRLGIRSRELYFEGKRFVLRGAHLSDENNSPAESDLAFARETWTAAIVSRPTTGLCELASRRGLLLIADLRTSNDNRSPSATAEAIHSVAPLASSRDGNRRCRLAIDAPEARPLTKSANLPVPACRRVVDDFRTRSNYFCGSWQRRRFCPPG